jgi:hypothetical protein
MQKCWGEDMRKRLEDLRRQSSGPEGSSEQGAPHNG